MVELATQLHGRPDAPVFSAHLPRSHRAECAENKNAAPVDRH